MFADDCQAPLIAVREAWLFSNGRILRVVLKTFAVLREDRMRKFQRWPILLGKGQII